NNSNIKKTRRYTTNGHNIHFLFQQEQGVGINYKTGPIKLSEADNSGGSSSSKENTTTLSISSTETNNLIASTNSYFTPASKTKTKTTTTTTTTTTSTSTNFNSLNNNNTNRVFTRSRSRSLNISKSNTSSPPLPSIHNIHNSSGNIITVVPNNSYSSLNSNNSNNNISINNNNNTSLNSLSSTSTSSLTHSYSNSSASSSTSNSSNNLQNNLKTSSDSNKIQGRKSKSSNALFKSLNLKALSSSRKRSSSISSSASPEALSSSTTETTKESKKDKKDKKDKKSKSQPQPQSQHSSTESLQSLTDSCTTTTNISRSSTPPLYRSSKLSNSKTSPPKENHNKNILEVSSESLKPSPKPIDNNSITLNIIKEEDLYNSNNNQNEENNFSYEYNNDQYEHDNNLINKLTDQLKEDPFFVDNNSATVNNNNNQAAAAPKRPPPLPPKNFKPSFSRSNSNMNPPTPPISTLSPNYSNSNRNSFNSLFKKSTGSSNYNIYPPSEPTYPSESSSKRSSVELKYLEDNHKYQLIDKLGSGTFSDVYLCIHKENKKQYAVKIIDKSLVQMIAAHTNMEIATEVNILKSSFHPHIIQMADHFETEMYYYIVTELLQGGELLYQLEHNHTVTPSSSSSSIPPPPPPPSSTNEATNYTEEHARQIIKQIVQAVGFLHSNKIVHRDLKPENILFRDRSMGSILKIIDFGLASYVSMIDGDVESIEPLIDVCGTPEFQAPEMVKRLGYSFPVDIWATGIILYILLCGHPPFQGKNNMAIMSLIIKSELKFDSPGWDNVSESAKDLIKQMLNPEPSQRLTAGQVLQHEWIQSHDNNNSSPQLGAFSRLRRYNSQRFFKQTGESLLKSQRFFVYSPEKELIKRRSINL
ncbi:hypothetical protein DICPUDRAFT_76173, partial [Dictyostelium purpureum]